MIYRPDLKWISYMGAVLIVLCLFILVGNMLPTETAEPTIQQQLNNFDRRLDDRDDDYERTLQILASQRHDINEAMERNEKAYKALDRLYPTWRDDYEVQDQ